MIEKGERRRYGTGDVEKGQENVKGREKERSEREKGDKSETV